MRSSIQPHRRNSALYRKYEDLILWLKFENNFDDSSYYDQQVIEFNPDVVPISQKQIDLPPFDDTTYVISPIDRKYTTYFEGTSLDKYSAAFNTEPNQSSQSLLVSGSGVFTADPQEDSALQMNIDSTSNFTFEFWAKHKYIPKGEDDDPGITYFDFGSLKFTNTSGVFSVHTPAGDQWDYYDRNFLLGLGNGVGRQGTTYKYHSVPTHASHSACFFTDQYISTSSNWPANLLYHTVAVDEGMLVVDINKQINITQDFNGYASSAPTNSTIEITLRKNGVVVSTFSKDVGTIGVGESCHITNFEGIHFIEVKKGDVITATSEQGEWWAFHFEVLEVDNASGPNLTNTFTHYAIQRRDNFIELWMGHKNLDGSDGQFKLVEAFEEPDDPEDPQRMNSYDVTGLSKVLMGEGPYFENWVAPYHDSRAIGSTISGTNFFTGWMDEFKVWGEAIYGPGSINPSGPYAVGVWCEETRRQFGIEMSSYDVKRAQPQSNPPNEKYIYENSSCFLWCQVATEYDARYSLHEPLPCHVEWYGTRHGLLGESSTSEWQPSPGTSTAKYVVGALGYHELIINDFVKDDEDIYYAIVKIGDPKRPKYTYRYYQDGLTPIKLHVKYRHGPITSCFSEGTKITLSDQSEKNIENIKVGDKVLSINEKTFKAEEDKVLEITSPVHDDMIRINFDRDIENKNTFDHPYYVKNKGWASYNPEYTKERYGLDVNQLEEGDVCYLYENNEFKEVKIISIAEELGKVQTYNLHKIKKNHNFLANGILVHNKSPVPALRWTMYNCPYTTVSLGQDVQLFVTMWGPGWNWGYPPLGLLPTHPSDIRWTNKGRGIETVLTGDAWHSGMLTFKNIRKGIKGPICAELTDANGLSWGPACCNGIFLRLPNLVCPTIISVKPEKSTNKFDLTLCPGKPTTTLCSSRQYTRGKCTMYTQMMILEGATSMSQKFEITAGDPNVSELQTGGLEYKWTIYGWQEIAGTWTYVNQTDANFGSDTSRTYEFLESFNGSVYCEVKYKNYSEAGAAYVYDPEGRAQSGSSTVMYWYVNFPECKEPSLWWHRPSLTSQGRADYINRVYGSAYVQKTIDLGRGKELGSSTYKIRCPSCTTALIPYSYYGNLAKWNYTIKSWRYWLSYKGFTKNISYSGTSSGYDSLAIANVSSPYSVYRYWDKGETDFLWKTVYLNDNKKTFIVKASNDCGGTQLEYVFDVYKMPPPRLYTQNLGSSSGGGWNQRYWWYRNWDTWDGADVNFYYQELDWYNWSTGKVESYYKHWPTTPQRHRTAIHGVSVGCAGYRIKVNGQVVQNWSDIPASYTSKNVTFAHGGAYYWGWWYGSRKPSMYVTFDNDRSNWGKDKNTVVIEVSNNLPAKGQYDQGDIGKFTWNINFNTLPKITSPTIWPRWGWWYCGFYHWSWFGNYRRSYWWWRPWCFWYTPAQGGWIKRQTSFVLPSTSTMPARRTLRGARLNLAP